MFQIVLSRVPGNSILDPILFNIFLNKILVFYDSDLRNFRNFANSNNNIAVAPNTIGDLKTNSQIVLLVIRYW